MAPVDFFPEARADYDESFDWYAEKSHAAAESFANAVDDALSRIKKSPMQYPFVDSLHRECGLRRFPFRIVYRVEKDRILVVAVDMQSVVPDFGVIGASRGIGGFPHFCSMPCA